MLVVLMHFSAAKIVYQRRQAKRLGSAIARGRYKPNPIPNPIHNRRGLAIAAPSYGGPWL